MEAGQGYCVALNAANEIAVEAFLEGRISFVQIYEVIAEVMKGDISPTKDQLDVIFDLDRSIRLLSHEIILRRLKS